MMGLPSLHTLDEYRLGAQRARIWMASEATDMRCGFDRLAERVRGVIGEDPLSGHLFVFRSRRGDRLKILPLGPGRIRVVVQAAGGGGVQAAARRGCGAGSGAAGQRAGDDPGRDRCVEAEAPAALPTWRTITRRAEALRRDRISTEKIALYVTTCVLLRLMLCACL